MAEAPVVSGFRATNRSFAPTVVKPVKKTAHRAKRKQKTVKHGTTLTYRLSKPATARITIARLRPGRVNAKGTCAAATRATRKRKACTRATSVTTLTQNVAAAGAVRTPFTGRVAKKALSAGSYRATIVATDASGARSIARTLTLHLVHG